MLSLHCDPYSFLSIWCMGPNFAESANVSDCVRDDEIDISGVWYGAFGIFQVYWRSGHLWMSRSSVEKHLYNVEGCPALHL